MDKTIKTAHHLLTSLIFRVIKEVKLMFTILCGVVLMTVLLTIQSTNTTSVVERGILDTSRAISGLSGDIFEPNYDKGLHDLVELSKRAMVDLDAKRQEVAPFVFDTMEKVGQGLGMGTPEKTKLEKRKAAVEKRRAELQNRTRTHAVRNGTHAHRNRTEEDPKKHAMKDAPIRRSVSPSTGEAWPRPQYIELKKSVLLLRPDTFKFKVDPRVLKKCDILARALETYKSEIATFWAHSQMLYQNGARPYSKRDDELTSFPLVTLDIALETEDCNGIYPPIEMNEAYTMYITEDASMLSASEIWGILRGLETFFQSLYSPYLPDNTLHIQGTFVKDQPAYPHRGLLLDTSRHYLPKAVILNNLDAMGQNKLNVFHWHIVDDQSFPFQSQKFPNLWKQGAFAPNLVYSFRDIKEIIDYARLKGIRVMPEFDTPGHTRGWLGQPGLLSECGKNLEKNTGVFDVTEESTYTFLKAFFTEVRGVFKDSMVHIGGDEVKVKCWYLNKKIAALLVNHTHHELLHNYFTRFQKDLKDIDSNWVNMVWEDVFHTYKVQFNTKQTWVNVWLHKELVATSMMKGLNTIFSGCWYLDHRRSMEPDWYKYYDCNIDRLKPKADKPEHGRLMGGEVCMWGEYVDDTNVIQQLWPRAVAPAERLWSNLPEMSRSPNVQERFQEQSCRMRRRGIRVSPLNGPGHCSGKMPFDSDETGFYSQWVPPSSR